IDGVGCPAHVGAPGIRAGLAASSGGLLTAERAADLGAGGPDVDVDDPAVGAIGGEESFGLPLIAGEDARRQSLGNTVVEGDRVLEVPIGHHVEDWGERLATH